MRKRLELGKIYEVPAMIYGISDTTVCLDCYFDFDDIIGGYFEKHYYDRIIFDELPLKNGLNVNEPILIKFRIENGKYDAWFEDGTGKVDERVFGFEELKDRGATYVGNAI